MLAWQPWEEQWPESVQPCHVNPRVLSQSCNDGDITGRINVAQATMVATCKLPTINAEDPFYPSSVNIYGDPSAHEITYNDNQNRILITETNSPIQILKSVFIHEGFSETILEIKKPDQISQGLMKRLTNDWDMHIRFIQIHPKYIAIDAEVETSREYLEHLTGKWISVIYEVIGILQKHRLAYAIWHKQEQKYVSTILKNGNLILDEISGKIAWKPLAIGAIVGISIGLLLNFLDDE